ncbi:transcriptional repressor [Candidatus Peregrinibacteria bacterium]|nr:transcriptional repressor [Candidatus Peregrinibacteria bacterium]
MQDSPSLLRSRGLRATEPRKQVIAALSCGSVPRSPQEIFEAVEGAVNLVTVYRMLEDMEKAGLVHRHHPTGKFVLCPMPEQKGHHGFLHCVRCGKTEEFMEPALCKIENTIAKRAGFTPVSHLSAIDGHCAACR